MKRGWILNVSKTKVFKVYWWGKREMKNLNEVVLFIPAGVVHN